jgi:hypothetical protein
LATPIAPSVAVAPVVTRPKIVSAVRANLDKFYRNRGRVHLARPIIGTALTAPVATRAKIVSAVQANFTRFRLSRVVHPRLAKPVQTLPPPPAPLWTKAFVISSVKANAQRFARGKWPKALVAPYVPVPTINREFWRPYSSEVVDELPFSTETVDVLPFSTEDADVLLEPPDDQVQ